jgi:CheY-like chemotaxis protein
MNENNRPIEILLVEDNPGDARLAMEGFREGKLVNNLSVAKDGVEALDFLHRRESFEDAPRPDLILLDLNLPKKDGREVLSEIKQAPDLRRIPVVVMTTSEAQEDIARSYDLQVNCYVTKPLDLDLFLEAIHSIEDFWLTTVTLPPPSPAPLA